MSSDVSVCVVDDDRPNLNMIRVMLETMNIKDVRCYSDAVHAWSDIQVTAPDFNSFPVSNFTQFSPPVWQNGTTGLRHRISRQLHRR
jgi:hypothetical protein